MKEKSFIKNEIESHSSNLFNQRIDLYFKIAASEALQANNAIVPNIQIAIAYHASLIQIFIETSTAHDMDETFRDKINAAVDYNEKVAKYLKRNPNAKQYYVEALIENCKKLHYLFHRSLQRLRYFFRFGVMEPRGIKQTLALFEQRDKKVENEISEYSGQL